MSKHPTYDVSQLTPETLQGILHLVVYIADYVDWVESEHLQGDLCPMRNEADGFMFEALDQHADALRKIGGTPLQ